MSNIKKTYLSQICNFKHIITNIILGLNKKKQLQIINANNYNKCIVNLNSNYEDLETMETDINNHDDINIKLYTKKLQEKNNNISKLIKVYGTNNLEDLIEICLGKAYLLEIKTNNCYEILNKYGLPIKYTIIDVNDSQTTGKDKIYTKLDIIKSLDNFTCIELINSSNNFFIDVHGLHLILRNKDKIILVTLLIENINPKCLNINYIKQKIKLILDDKPKTEQYNKPSFDIYINSLHVKDYLLYNNLEIYTRYINSLNMLEMYKKYTLNKLSKEYLSKSLKEKRDIIITLLYDDNVESQFISYLLYDLLSNDLNDNNIDSLTQIYLYNSFPWNIKLIFKEAIKNTLDYNKKLFNFDSNTIPLEQQISLMKTSDLVKEKAFAKLKEIKSKSEDSGTKAKTYLDMLLKIPFGIYTEEEILKLNKVNNELYIYIMDLLHKDIDKENINNLIIKKHLPEIESFLSNKSNVNPPLNIEQINKLKKKDLLTIANKYNIQTNKKNKIQDIREDIKNYINQQSNKVDKTNIDKCSEIKKRYNTIIENNKKIQDYLIDCKKTLDNSVYGHELAKTQLLRIIGQWINGENSGYSFGFEGPPGVGKTSLAKLGLANCLIDHNGNSRPFSFIAIGGDANSSTLAGHNYTYVGSSPGRLVEILIETETSNPIIFIDELDKISKTEQGKEIIGILTHLIDPSQNSHYQDKYFSGIDIDMSKVLFIFSYNDVSSIDRILLDRIHRIKFDHLNIFEKKIITKKYILPDTTNIMGLKNMIHIDDDVIEFIINTYTLESGVRKLKELIFEIVGDINLNILKNMEYETPITVSIEDVKHNYLKNRTPISITKVYEEDKIGLVNGLWANSLGKGGILHIECKLTLGQNLLDFKLTGSLGDVMKESMNVAKTLAWSLLSESEQKKLVKQFDETKTQCIHLHTPEGATPKDGPSAGTAITIAIYSLLSKKLVRHDVAITGEIDLNGNVTAIGGLELKVLGGIAAGVKEFIYPHENNDDYLKMIKKYENKDIFDNIKFNSVKHIDDVLKIIIL